jgi:hypothetical protein
MKKIIIIIVSTLFVVTASLYILLFTSMGNNILRPSIEAKINENTPIKVKLEEFFLRMDKLRLVLKTDDDNLLLAEGSYSLFKQSFDIDYTLRLAKLASLNTLIQRKLSGRLLTDGKISGNLDLFKIKGKSDIASSATDYAIVIQEKSLNKAAIKLLNADIRELLAMAGETPYASGKIDLHVQLMELKPPHLKGNVLLNVKDARLDAAVLQKEFGLDISRTSLRSGLTAKLDGEDIVYDFDLDSELAALSSKGKINAGNKSVHADYSLHIKELAFLKSITKSPLRGPFATQGELKGDEKELFIKGSSDLARSKTSYTLTLNDFKPGRMDLRVKDAELSRLLYLAGEPSYADGSVDIDARLSSLSPLQGKSSLTVSRATLHKDVIQESFEITLPNTTFELKSDAVIKDDKVTASSVLTSNLATLKMKKTDLEISTAYLSSDYDLFIPSLQRLEPILERKLIGKLNINGEIRKEKKLTITAYSDIFNGKVNAKMVDTKLDADFKDLQAIEVLKMLSYPQVINASVEGSLSYDTASKKGRLDTRFDTATLTRSQMTDLIGALSHSDLTKERFNQGSLISLIDKEIITSELAMQSKRVNLNSKRFIINSKKQLIDAHFAIKVKEYPGDVIVTGDINAPKVRLDAKSMVTPEVKEKVTKEINRFLKKLF